MKARLTRRAAAEFSQIAATLAVFIGGLWQWIDPPKRWPGIRVLEFVGPVLIGAGILLGGFAILNGLRRLARLERTLEQEQAQRTKAFGEWLENRSRQISDFFEARITRLTADAETTK